MQLKPIERTDRSKNRLNAALGIYRETILPEAQNPERQIIYWIEHSKESLADEFRCFAIEAENKVVGYLQLSYFREENIFFFEYLCISDKRAAGLVPSQAMTSIANWLSDNYPPNYSIVFEVAHTRRSNELWQPDERLIKYFKRIGFRAVDFAYRYPALQSYDGAISYPAILMVRLPNRRTEVAAAELRTILRCIYFKHYLRWDRPFLDAARFAQREELINELYSTQVAAIRNDDTFGTSGSSRASRLDMVRRDENKIGPLLERAFGPKLPRIMSVMVLLLLLQWRLGNTLLLVPFVLTSAAVYCLAEDTTVSRKLFRTLLGKLKVGPPRL
jgi:hypothetical protein